jgi:hypothetical protein
VDCRGWRYRPVPRPADTRWMHSLLPPPSSDGLEIIDARYLAAKPLFEESLKVQRQVGNRDLNHLPHATGKA